MRNGKSAVDVALAAQAGQGGRSSLMRECSAVYNSEYCIT